MSKFYLGCVLIAAVVVAVPVAAFIYLRTATALLVTLLYLALIPLILKLALKGAVGASWILVKHAQKRMVEEQKLMSGAAVSVHRFEEVPKPSAEKMSNCQPLDKHHGPHRYMLLDCTISPPMKECDSWEPSLLYLGQDDATYQKPQVEDGRVDPAEGKIAASRVWFAILDTAQRELEVPEALHTPARLRLVFACPANMKGAVRLLYMHTPLCELKFAQ